MAIYGAGSIWNKKEKRKIFFENENYILGWNDENASDLYAVICAVKVGDIIYLKSNKPGSRKIKIKGIGIVTQTVLQSFEQNENLRNWKSLQLKVLWVSKNEYNIEINKKKGKLTNVRAATFYEEFLPCVQLNIVSNLIKKNYHDESKSVI